MNYSSKTTEILDAHDLNFTIEKAPLHAIDSNGNTVLSPYFGLINTSTNEVINTCKKGYTVSQNGDVVEMVLKGMAPFGSKLEVTKAGSINGGRRVFLQLRIDGDGKVGNDTVKRFVTVIDSNDGSTGLSIGIGDLTMSCMNQFFKFYAAGDAKFRHTATIEAKIRTIPSLITTALDESLKQIEIYNAFQSTTVSKELAHAMVKHVLGYDRMLTSADKFAELGKRSLDIMDSLYNHIEHEYNDKGVNLWGLHSGVTRWTTQEKTGPKRLNGNYESMLSGVAYKANIASLEFAANKAGLILS